ncbi:hypothetical protein GCM10020358_71160 [Amorphoplanes nipponensis]
MVTATPSRAERRRGGKAEVSGWAAMTAIYGGGPPRPPATCIPHLALALAQSMWHDRYGDAEDPELLGFGRRKPGEPGPPAAVWQAFKSEWRELACTDNENKCHVPVSAFLRRGGGCG